MNSTAAIITTTSSVTSSGLQLFASVKVAPFQKWKWWRAVA